MSLIVKTVRDFGLGVGTGLVVGLLLYLTHVQLALVAATVIALTILLSLVFVVAYGRTFRMKLTEEDYQRRGSMVPFIMGLAIAVLAVYLGTGGPTVPKP